MHCFKFKQTILTAPTLLFFFIAAPSLELSRIRIQIMIVYFVMIEDKLLTSFLAIYIIQIICLFFPIFWGGIRRRQEEKISQYRTASTF